ncbi:hypothetical protein MHUMG1_02941 [Metarhizium humberi]|uniref:Uncharacterized protein n=1 Tax=Metarhizium humberi TaxID=2596975 RepID=A0A9P8S8Q0_9HYPO|nr:hypothetical protein MHUMG1_02941 [Metarhizium humberi]
MQRGIVGENEGRLERATGYFVEGGKARRTAMEMETFDVGMGDAARREIDQGQLGWRKRAEDIGTEYNSRERVASQTNWVQTSTRTPGAARTGEAGSGTGYQVRSSTPDRYHRPVWCACGADMEVAGNLGAHVHNRADRGWLLEVGALGEGASGDFWTSGPLDPEPSASEYRHGTGATQVPGLARPPSTMEFQVSSLSKNSGPGTLLTNMDQTSTPLDAERPLQSI